MHSSPHMLHTRSPHARHRLLRPIPPPHPSLALNTLGVQILAIFILFHRADNYVKMTFHEGNKLTSKQHVNPI